MWERLYIASGNRLPIIMTTVNRALSAPINIHCDHSDAMGARDAGWIQLYSENAQEAYDNLIQAVRIAEHRDVRLPVMVCMDGFIISHSIERMEMLDDMPVRNFIGPFKANYPLLDINNPVTYGPIDLQDYYIEHKRQQAEAMKLAGPVILEIGKEFGETFGRSYGFFEGYMLDDAELVIVGLGSSTGTVRSVVDELRAKGIAAGLLKLRTFRPFPAHEIAAAIGGAKAVAVLDRSDSFGAYGGPLFSEVRSALFGKNDAPPVVDYIYGLGGRDFGIADVHGIFDDLQDIVQNGAPEDEVQYITVRE